MECCGIAMSDFSYFRNVIKQSNRVPHFHCIKCGNRHHDGVDYTKEEWFFYVNEETYAEYRVRLDNDYVKGADNEVLVRI